MEYRQEAEIYPLPDAKMYSGGPISFSGPSAVGKSTIGRLVAEKMGMPFIDLDDEVSKKAGLATTKEVMRNFGHTYFKQLQSDRLNDITTNTPHDYVLAAGGEIFRPGYDRNLITRNRILLKRHTYNICLVPSNTIDEVVQVLFPRLNDGKRDTRTSSPEEFRKYVEVAVSQYIGFAHQVVFTHTAPPEATLLQVVKLLMLQ